MKSQGIMLLNRLREKIFRLNSKSFRKEGERGGRPRCSFNSRDISTLFGTVQRFYLATAKVSKFKKSKSFVYYFKRNGDWGGKQATSVLNGIKIEWDGNGNRETTFRNNLKS